MAWWTGSMIYDLEEKKYCFLTWTGGIAYERKDSKYGF